MPSARAVMDKVLGVAPRRRAAAVRGAPFRKTAGTPRSRWPVRDGERTPGKVAIFATCYVNYNEPGIGHDLVKILAHNEMPYRIVEKEACCGMPKLELGDLEAVEKLKNVNIPQLAALARDGYAILTAVPSCTLMFKQELPLHLPRGRRREGGGGRDVRSVRVPRAARQGRAAEEGLQAAARQGELSHPLPLARAERRPEDARGAGVDARTPTVNTVERCAGHDGTYGVKTEFFAASMKIGKPVFGQMAQTRARLRELRLPDRRAADPAGDRRRSGDGARSHGDGRSTR